MEVKKEQQTSEQKQDAMFNGILEPKNPDGSAMAFQNEAAKSRFRSSVGRLRDAIRLRESDRIPVTLFPSMYPLKYCGISVEESMRNYNECAASFKKFYIDFKSDFNWGAIGPGPSKVYEILDYRLYAWPGHGVGADSSYQCLEDEYMKAEEYDLLLSDPSLYFRNFYLPRVFGALNGLSMLPPWTGILEMYGVAINFIPFGIPPVQASFQALFEAGAEALKWISVMGQCDGEMASLGYPSVLGGFTKAPFDVLGDTLRGTKGIMTDMFRQPDKLLAALDALTPIMINMGVASARQTGNPLIFIPLHKGADGFMSDEQYRKFYWPSLRKVIIGLIENGCVPFPAAEGCYNTRLDIIREIPRGKTIWMFDQTDIFRAKETVGDTLCIFGNISSAMIALSTPDEIREHTRKIIDKLAPGGGFVLANGAFFDDAKPENLDAIIETGLKYGVF
ncbi:MAG: hypothetical protein JW874_01950 [Spirochaetales bacterium]|nr:hypothetical protein [Spirochaetales bacterium]